MGWRTTSDLDEFTAAAGGYLRSRAAEHSLLLSAEQDARSVWGARAAGDGPGAVPEVGHLYGWWEPPDGGTPRGAFLHDPAAPLLVAGRVPELAAALAATLAKAGQPVGGVDAPTEAADAFAAAWSQRSGTAARVHRRRNVYLLAADTMLPGGGPGMPPAVSGHPGRLRVATAADLPLLTGWIDAFTAESAERIGSPAEFAANLIGYGGAVFWEVPHRQARLRGAAQHLGMRWEASPVPESGYQPVALAALTRPVAGCVRISLIYTPPDRRRSGHAAALTLAISRTLLPGQPGQPGEPSLRGAPGAAPSVPDTVGCPGLLGGPAARSRVRVREIVMITDGARPARWGSRLPYQLISERTVLRFGPVTGPLPRLGASGSTPRLPTGPLPRLPRLGR
jgi:hypothetical protein